MVSKSAGVNSALHMHLHGSTSQSLTQLQKHAALQSIHNCGLMKLSQSASRETAMGFSIVKELFHGREHIHYYTGSIQLHGPLFQQQDTVKLPEINVHCSMPETLWRDERSVAAADTERCSEDVNSYLQTSVVKIGSLQLLCLHSLLVLS